MDQGKVKNKDYEQRESMKDNNPKEMEYFDEDSGSGVDDEVEQLGRQGGRDQYGNLIETHLVLRENVGLEPHYDIDNWTGFNNYVGDFPDHGEEPLPNLYEPLDWKRMENYDKGIARDMC